MEEVGAATPKVSVVVPVYNPGRYLDRCVASLLEQTLPADEFEVVFVDDGSTDDTPERLDALASQHRNVRVLHIPNSGWPGKPRNVGVAAARGEYVQFLDQDDRLGPDALRRLYTMGHDHAADVVLGKVTSNFRRVPQHVFRENRTRCTAADAPLIDSLTPHKMLRRQFLLDTGLEFPEGKRRLEDQLYMVQAYLDAASVAIVGDYPCYYYLRRDDRGNAGTSPIDPAGYYRNLRDVLDAIVARVPAGDFRNALLRRFYRVEMLGRLSVGALKQYDDERLRAVLDEVLSVDADYMNDDIRDGLDAAYLLRSRAVHTREPDRIRAANAAVQKVTLRTRAVDLRWSGEELVVHVQAVLRDGRERALTVLREGERFRFDPRRALGLDDDAVDVTEQVAEMHADVTVRDPETAVEWYAAHDLRPRLRKVGRDGSADVMELSFEGPVRLRPLGDGTRDPLAPGTWEVVVRVDALGFGRSSRVPYSRLLGRERSLPAATLGPAETVVVPAFPPPRRTLALVVANPQRAAVGDARPSAADAAAWLLRRLPPRTRLRLVAAADAARRRVGR